MASGPFEFERTIAALVDSAELLENAEIVHVEGVDATIASVEDLVTIKQAAARPRDLADIEALNARRED